MFCLMFSQIWQAALGALNPNPTDSCPLYLNHAAVAAVPSRVSRHNSPSSAHFVSRLVRSCLPGGNNRCIVVSISILRILYVAAYQLIVIPVWGIFFPGALKATEQICGFIILWLLVEILWPSASSRGNVPSGRHECLFPLQMVCERSDVFASSCAIARAFPIFSRRSSSSRRAEKKHVTVEFVIVGQESTPLDVVELEVQHCDIFF